MLLASAVLAVAAGCGSRALDGAKSDGGPESGLTNMCANAGCGAPPLCSQGCQAACGCCACAEGERNGNLTCRGGCYVPDPTPDGGTDAHTGGWVQPAACKLPFEAGPCEALFSVFAYVDGACVPRTYGGCGGNDNRFSTLEECLATCEGRPAQACPSGRVSHTICVACGAAGGCAKTITACALPCDLEVPCPPSVPFCFQGVCQVGGCI